jgi:hypothetical protein
VRVADSTLAWRAWPLLHRPVLGGVAALVGVATLWGVWSGTGNAWFCFAGAVVIAVGVGPFFVPTRYRLTSDGLEIARLFVTRRRAWSEFRVVHRDRDAVVLSPASRTAWIPGREVTLFLEGNGEEVGAYVEQMVGTASGGSAA